MVTPTIQHSFELITNLLKTGQWQQAQEEASTLLVASPRVAQLWVFLGESLEHQGLEREAWASYDRAWMLDPEASWVEGVQRRIGDRSRKNLPPWLNELLAVPLVKIVAAMIARNEAETIGLAVERLVPAVDAVFVMDTGSDDNTVKIAQQAGATVYQCEWQDDFAQARNSLSPYFSGFDWVLWVDADEILEEEDQHIPRIAAGLFHMTETPTICRIVQVNHLDGRIESNVDMSRMYPVGRGLRWWGRIHEQIGSDQKGVFGKTFSRPPIRLRLHHWGYEPSVMQKKNKLERNIKLLEESIKNDPRDIASMGFLGRELGLSGRIEESVKCLTQTELLAPEFPTYGRLSEIRSYLIEMLIKLGRLQEALAVAERLVSQAPEYPSGWYLKGKVELGIAVKMLDEARSSLGKCQQTYPGYRGIVSVDRSIPDVHAPIALADVAKLQGKWTEALALYQTSLKHRDSKPVNMQIDNMFKEAKGILENISSDEKPE